MKVKYSELMPAKHLMIAIDWYGPYRSKAHAAQATKDWEWYSDGLYLAIGPHRGQKALKYIGISTNICSRLSGPHHSLDYMRISQIWLGEIVTAEPSGKKVKVTKATLDYAEWLHAFFLQIPRNSKKTFNAPSRPSTVLNRWWNTEMKPRRNRPHPDWPNLIDHPLYGQLSRAVWFGGRQKPLGTF